MIKESSINSQKRVRKISNLVLATISIIGGIIFIFPIYWMVRSSVMNLGDLFSDPPLLFPTMLVFENYTNALNEMHFVTYLGNSLIVTIGVVLGTLLTSSLSAYGFARFKFPLKDFWFALILSTMMLPAIITLFPTFLIWNQLGQKNHFTPLIAPAWLGGGAFFIFMLRQFFMTIPKDLDEAAKLDGASYFKIYYKIMLPLIKPALVVVGLFSFIGSWNEFFLANIYLDKEYKFTLSLGLASFQGVHYTEYSYIMAASAVVALPSIILFIIGNKYFVEGIALTGIKG